MTEVPANRSIRIEENAVGSVIVSGDGNTINVIQQALESRQQARHQAVATDLAPNPYQGLAAFQESDADRYFGREEQVQRLWKRFQALYAESGTPQVLSLLGPSGCGKSSLARAGLIPELARRPLPGKSSLRVAVLVPGDRPLEALAGILAKAATKDPLPVEKAAEFERVLQQQTENGEYDGLRRITSLLPGIRDTPLLILVAQFEEVYSLCGDSVQRQAFIDNLFHASNTPTKEVSVVITLRSDFLGEAQRHPLLNQIMGSDQSLIVPIMTSEELRRAIAIPAQQAKHPLDDAMVDLLVKDAAGHAGTLPLLQFTLVRIWEGLSTGKTPITTYREIGGVGGALAQKAQEIYDGLAPTQQTITRRLFRSLVHVQEDSQYVRRRLPEKSLISPKDDPLIVQEVINRFSQADIRLLTRSGHGQVQTIEVTHEALFEHFRSNSA